MYETLKRTPLELAIRMMDVLHFRDDRDEPWWSFAIFHAQRTQSGCAIYRCQPGQSIFDVGTVFGLSIDDTVEDAIFGAIADAMTGGELAQRWKGMKR